MSKQERYEFGDFALEVAQRRLLRSGQAVHLEPKAYDVLVELVRGSGKLVTKQELLARVWPEAFVEEGILTVHISSLRKALGDLDRPPKCIETVPRSGYRFVAHVTPTQANDEDDQLGNGVCPIEVYELVGRGRIHLLAASHFELPAALAAFQSAIEIDPSYAASHAGLALTRCAQAAFRVVPHAQAYTAAKASALRALAMDSHCADAQVALGVVLFLSEWDWMGAERSLRRALEINRAHSEALLHYGSLMEALGQLDKGLRLKQQALERDPRSPMVCVQIAASYWHQRRYDDAIVWANKALDLDPKQLLAGEFLAGVHWARGDVDAFVEENLRRARVFGAPADALDQIPRAGSEMKNAFEREGLVGINRYMLQHVPRSDDSAAVVRLAVLSGAVGDFDTAFANLDQALEAHDPALVHLAVAPQWDSLREDPRFRQRLARMGLAR
jgi:DNA-binding winged helix-turn-helix (wHTH) protein/Tfp pilus assembly protein PilF